MKALVTGGSGFIGSHLTRELLDRGDQVVVLDNLSTGRLPNVQGFMSNPSFQFIDGSVLDKECLKPQVEAADIVYHMAAAVGVKFVVEHLIDTLENNLRGTQDLLELAHQCGNKKVILASSSEVYGNSPEMPWKEDGNLSLGPTSVGRWGYACSKILDEFLALAYYKEKNLPVVVLRFFNTVGPGQSGRYGMVLPRFVSQAMAGEPITVYGNGDQSRCFTYVGEVVKAMVDISHVPEAEGQVFNIGSLKEISINQLAKLVKNTVESDSPIVHVRYDSEFGSDFADIARRVPDISKIRRFIDFEPKTELDQVIREVAGSLAPMGAGSQLSPEKNS